MLITHVQALPSLLPHEGGGRKPVVTAEKLRHAQVLLVQRLNVREGAARLRVGKTALYEALAAERAKQASGRRAYLRLPQP